jgi:hypothetical protein
MASSATEAHLEAALSEFDQALRALDCPVCAEYLNEVRAQADLLLDLYRKARTLTERQMAKRQELETMETNANRMMGLPESVRPSRSSLREREGRSRFFGNGGFGFRDVLRDRPRVADYLNFGGRS